MQSKLLSVIFVQTSGKAYPAARLCIVLLQCIVLGVKIVACRGATNERMTEGLMCGGPLRAVRAEEENPRPGLS